MTEINSQHVYNIIAKEIREALSEHVNHLNQRKVEVATLGALAFSFAKRFQRAPDFEVRTFLNKCTPDPFKFNLVILWDRMEDDGA